MQDLDGLPLDQISVATIENWRDALASILKSDGKQLLNAKSIARHMTACSAVFKDAQRLHPTIINPVTHARRPRQAVKELDGDEEPGERSIVRSDEVFSGPEIQRLIENTTPGLYRMLIAMAASTGARGEELCALRWSDVAMGESPSITIRRSLSRARGLDDGKKIRAKFYPPKTKAGYRTIDLPIELLPMLREWKLRAPAGELVFAVPSGQPLHRATISDAMAGACRRAGLRVLTLKNLRHSLASNLLKDGCPITEVAAILGHAHPGITLKTYSHFVPSAKSAANARFGASFLSPLSGNGQKTQKVVS